MDKRQRLSARLTGIILLGTLAAIGIDYYRGSKRPCPAPFAEQQKGYARIREVLRRVETSKFGQSPRGRLLCRKIPALMDAGDVVFTRELKTMGLFRSEVLGPKCLYLKVYRNSDTEYAHLADDLLAGALFHETVHALRPAGSSVEEECDGYAAGLTASAIVAGEETPVPLVIDGKAVAEYVLKEYPDRPRDPAYQPVGLSREALLQQTGLRE